MITGYNTDVRHNDVVFHVQTEDKGQGNPTIESLVYVGGQVLATKRASYADLLSEGKDDKSIVALMDHQHRTMIAAIRHGKFDERLMALSGMRPDPRPDLRSASGAYPVAAAAPAAAARSAERSLDQVILEYLTNEADQEQLLLVFDGEPSLQRGGTSTVVLRTSSSKSGGPVAGAQVSVKMISTIAEPRLLSRGSTDEQGTIRLSFEIPAMVRGTAALIISAASPIGRAELKHLL
ncbi:MAG TPA: hypothetical protein VFI63_02925 [Solirubrobacterales bacterium]|nr:hypothetical protein [Solirubrobacterales bacterium]